MRRFARINRLKDLSPALCMGQANPPLKALILDFDGVLSAHGEAEFHPEVMVWLKEGMAWYREAQVMLPQVCVWTNALTPARVHFLKRVFPDFQVWQDFPKKPNPRALRHFLKESRLSPASVLLVDDRLTTGIWAGALAGVRLCWVQKPYQDFKRRFFKESWFSLLRGLEKGFYGIWNVGGRLLRFFQTSEPQQ